MLYQIVTGSRDAALKRAHKAESDFLAKYPDGRIFRLTPDNFKREEWEELLSAPGLFSPKFLIIGDDLMLDKEIAAIIEPTLPFAKESTNVFLLIDLEVVKKTKLTINPFAITDALGRRDRQNIWLQFQLLLRANVATEEIFWKLVWQIKTMLLIKQSGDKKIASLKPFVLQKNTSYIRNYTLPELTHLSSSLVSLWHDHKREVGHDFTTLLESWILAV